MAGLLDDATPPAASPSAPSHALSDPLLEQVKQHIETKLPPALQDGYQRIVVAGLKVLYSPQTQPSVSQIMQKIQQGGFNPKQIATAIVNLLGMIFGQSNKQMSIPSTLPAGITLMAYILDDMKKMVGLQITPPLIKTVGQLVAQLFVKAFGIQTGAPSAQPSTAPPTQPVPSQGD